MEDGFDLEDGIDIPVFGDVIDDRASKGLEVQEGDLLVVEVEWVSGTMV